MPGIGCAMHGLRHWRLALGLVLFGVAAGCRSLPSPPPLLDGGLVSSSTLLPDQERIAQAHAFFSTGIHHELVDEYDLAYESYRQAAALEPGNERLVLRMASTLVLQRKTEEALRVVEEFLKRNPTSESALLWLATFYGTTGDQERVVQLFRQMTRQFPDKPLGWLQLAAATGRSGDTNAVVEILETGLSKARPPTALRQELVRIQLDRMQATEDPGLKSKARQQAIALLRQVAEELPGDVETLYVLGDLLAKDDQLEEAIRVYEKIERLQPADLQVKQRLARTFLAMDDQPKAIAVLEKLSQNQKNPGNVNYFLAELYLQAGEVTNAAAHFRAAAETSPGDPSPWLKLAAIQAEKDPDQAVATLAEALEKLPGNPKLLEVLALVRLNQKRYEQAADLMQQAFDAVIAKDPEAIPSNLFFYNFATICTHLRRTQEAATWLRRAVEQEPALLDLYMQRAMTGTLTFRKNATSILLALADLPSTESAAIHAHLASLYLSQDKSAKAVREFATATEIVKKDPLQAAVLTPRFYFWFGVALDQNKQAERAVEMFETCLRLDSNYADALNYLAYLWANQGVRLDEALRYIQTALALDPENAAYLDTLGWIYYQQGRFADALDLLEQADKLRPDDDEIRGHIEKVREKLAP
jgi:tetratricopeptide (TPR) repeat protein